MALALSTNEDANNWLNDNPIVTWFKASSYGFKNACLLVFWWWALPLAILYWPSHWAHWPLALAFLIQVSVVMNSLEDGHFIGYHREHGVPMYEPVSDGFLCFEYGSYPSVITIVIGLIFIYII